MSLDNINFNDIFKNSFLENFSSNLSNTTICVTLLYAFLISIYVYVVYKYTTKNIVYSRKFNVTMCLMSIITAGIVLSMQANLVVSLGMVGALSIVRFRTAVKEPRDLLFLFWSISNGIVIGAQIYSIALIMSIVLSFAMLFFELIPEKGLPYLLVVNLNKDENCIKKIEDKLKNNKTKFRVKSKNITKTNISIIYELKLKKNKEIVNDISKTKGVSEVTLLAQDGESQY